MTPWQCSRALALAVRWFAGPLRTTLKRNSTLERGGSKQGSLDSRWIQAATSAHHSRVPSPTPGHARKTPTPAPGRASALLSSDCVVTFGPGKRIEVSSRCARQQLLQRHEDRLRAVRPGHPVPPLALVGLHHHRLCVLRKHTRRVRKHRLRAARLQRGADSCTPLKRPPA